MPGCYQSIRALKLREAQLVAKGYFAKIGEPAFYPTWNGLDDNTLDSRWAVNQRLGLE
jgi:hypothetical protein